MHSFAVLLLDFCDAMTSWHMVRFYVISRFSFSLTSRGHRVNQGIHNGRIAQSDNTRNIHNGERIIQPDNRLKNLILHSLVNIL